MSKLADAAAKYAARGTPVFPVKPRSKEPLVDGGFHAATTDENTIAGWWERVPDANIGSSPGAANRVAIDVDPRNGGDESFARLEERYGVSPSTAEVLTGGGGAHYWFSLPEGVTIRSRSDAFGPDFPGIDVKSALGYVLLPPSIHPSGEPYRWDAGDRTIAEIPPAWLDALIAAEEAGKRVAPQLGDVDDEIPEGKRNSTLTKIAGAMRRHRVGYEEIHATLVAENSRRCRPPLPEGDLRRIASSISRYPSASLTEPAHNGQLSTGGVLRFDDLAKRSTESIDWFIEGLLRRSGILLMASQPKVGKSDTARNAANAVARGTEFLGRRCQKGRVLWIGLEEPMSHLHERIEIMGMQELDIVYVIEQPVGDEAAWLRAVVETHEPIFVIIDTIGRFSKIENVNDYSQVARATQPILDLRSRLGTTFCLLHHNNHANKTLGSTMWEGVVDTIMSLSRNPDGTRFVQTKQRSGIDLEPTVLTMNQDTGMITCSVPAFIADQRIAEKRILEHLRTVENATREDLARMTGRKVAAGRAAVDALVAAGLVRSQGTGARGSPRLYSVVGSERPSPILVQHTGLLLVEDTEDSEASGRGMLRGNPRNPEDSGLSEDSEDSEETWPMERPGDLGDC